MTHCPHFAPLGEIVSPPPGGLNSLPNTGHSNGERDSQGLEVRARCGMGGSVSVWRHPVHARLELQQQWERSLPPGDESYPARHHHGCLHIHPFQVTPLLSPSPLFSNRRTGMLEFALIVMKGFYNVFPIHMGAFTIFLSMAPKSAAPSISPCH